MGCGRGGLVVMLGLVGWCAGFGDALSAGLRPVRYGYAPPSVEKLLGALPVVAEFCRQLDLQGIVDRACPVHQVARVTHGQVIEALVANRLTSPRPLLRVTDWARQWAVEEVFGIAPGRAE
jgi:Domain of unknown function (DUF4277)